MSQENLEIVKRIYAAWEKGDFGAGFDDLDPQVMFIVRADFPEAGAFVGPDGVATYMRRFLAQWENARIESTGLQAVGDTVLARSLLHSTGRVSQIEGELPYFMLFTFRGGKIVRIETVMHEAEALEAVGLSE
jgi:ketosteroid isomerase-like protein